MIIGDTSTNETLFTNDIRQIVITVMEQLDDTRIYFELRKAKMLNNSKSVANIKILLALAKVGIPITSGTFAWIKDCQQTSAVTVLHNYGDKNILVWKRTGREKLSRTQDARTTCYVWILSPYLQNLLAFCFKKVQDPGEKK